MNPQMNTNEIPRNEHETRNPWQTPVVEVLMVDRTENGSGTSSDAGIGFQES